MNLLREEYCKEINTPMGLDNVYDYVKWLENKLTEAKQALQLQQGGVVGRSEQLSCDTCIWKNRTYVKCGVCNNYDKYEKAT